MGGGIGVLGLDVVDMDSHWTAREFLQSDWKVAEEVIGAFF